MFCADHVGGEVVGLDALAGFAVQLWGGTDASARLVDHQPLRIRREGEQVVLSIELPFTERDQIDLTRNVDELFIAVGPHRRNLVLPESLRRREICTANLVDGHLQVAFGSIA